MPNDRVQKFVKKRIVCQVLVANIRKVSYNIGKKIVYRRMTRRNSYLRHLPEKQRCDFECVVRSSFWIVRPFVFIDGTLK